MGPIGRINRSNHATHRPSRRHPAGHHHRHHAWRNAGLSAMTPLIEKAVRMHPAPESYMWFDIGQMQPWPGGRVLVDTVMNLPFPRIGFVGLDQTGKDFALWLGKGEESQMVFVAAASMWHGTYMDPFAYMATEEGIQYYRGNGKITQEEVRPVFRMVCAVLLKIAEQSTVAYKPVAQNTYINRKRQAKGKPCVIFDWHTVEVGPKAIKAEPQGGTHASPRLHDRRGHYRVCKSGKKVWVKSCKVGDASKGVVFKDYIVH